MKKESGIYGILNNINNKIYIGSSKDMQSRWRFHKNKLVTNKHHNSYLQSSWNKYGGNNFSFIILENNIEIENLIHREMFWIKLKDSLISTNGYNLAIPSDTQLYTYSEETKLKIGYITYKKNKPEVNEQEYLQFKIEQEIKKQNQRKINKEDLELYQIDKVTGVIIKEFPTSGIAAKELTFKKEKIQDVLRGDRSSYKGFIFIYKRNYNPDKQYVIIKNQGYTSRRKPVNQYGRDMNLIKEWSNPQEINEVLGYSIPSIYDAICRKRVYKDCYWSRK